MKNTIKLIGIIAFIAVLGFSFISCEEDAVEVENTVGRLTITGFSGVQAGYHIYAFGDYDGEIATAFACEDITAKDGNFTYGELKNNQVTLNVWKCDNAMDKFTNYNVTKNNVFFYVYCYEIKDTKGKASIVGNVTVNFVNGIGSGVITIENPGVQP